MTPQEWIESAKQADGQLENLWFIAEGATHLAAALEEIARLRADAGRVVVPELTESDLCQQCTALRTDDGSLSSKMAKNQRFNFVNGYALATSRAHSVPSSRILKDGEHAVDAREFSLLSQHWQLWEKEAADRDVHDAQLEVVFALTELYEKRDALRTQATATESGKAREVEG